MMPLAHASNVGGGDQSNNFLASLCTSNGFVLINLDINADQDAPTQKSSTSVGTQCPLCTNLEQDILDITLPAAVNVAPPTVIFATEHQLYLAEQFSEKQSIRAPPHTLTI